MFSFLKQLICQFWCYFMLFNSTFLNFFLINCESIFFFEQNRGAWKVLSCNWFDYVKIDCETCKQENNTQILIRKSIHDKSYLCWCNWKFVQIFDLLFYIIVEHYSVKLNLLSIIIIIIITLFQVDEIKTQNVIQVTYTR